MTMTEHQITDAEYAAALAVGQAEAEMEVRAQAVRYVPDRDAIEIVTNRNAGFLIPGSGSAYCRTCRRKNWQDWSSGRMDRRLSLNTGISTSACMG